MAEEEKAVEEGTIKSKLGLMVGVAVVVLVIIGGVWFANRGQGEEAMMEGDKMEEEATMEERVQVVEVEGGSFYFKPNKITAKEGETVRVVFTNAGGIHDFVLDEFDVKTRRSSGGEAIEVEFVVGEKGEYNFYCSVGNHRAQGMEGTLVVE